MKMTGVGRKPLNLEVYGPLRVYFDGLRGQHRVVTVSLLCAEWKRISKNPDMPNKSLQHRIY